MFCQKFVLFLRIRPAFTASALLRFFDKSRPDQFWCCEIATPQKAVSGVAKC